MANKLLNHQETLVEYIPLKVSAGVLLQIGAGIYDSVAAAFKEFVSNAFDADASAITILTDYPRFEQIKIVDDGSGMSAQRFKQAMQMIGTSLKGTIDPIRVTPKYKRPIIGRLGIGLMALSQLCNKAIIESTVKGEPSKFVAELDFSANQSQEAAQLDVFREQYGGLENMKQILASPQTPEHLRREVQEYYDLALQANIELLEKKLEDPEGEQLGSCVIYGNLPALADDYGTTITLTEIRPSVTDFLSARQGLPRRRRGQESAQHARYLNGPLSQQVVHHLKWQEMVEKLCQPDSDLTVQSLPPYYQFLWELALTSPVEYLPNGPVSARADILAHKKKELSRFDFSLIVDNRKLIKPILLPSGGEQDDYQIEDFTRHRVVGGERLIYQGYIYWHRKAVPVANRGLQIYIRNVGIGIYDHRFMKFSDVNPTANVANISGEIYIETGLERALNLARNGFREKDEHYLALQQDVWEIVDTITKRKSQNGQVVGPNWPLAEALLIKQKLLMPVKAAVRNGSSSEDVLKLLEKLVFAL